MSRIRIFPPVATVYPNDRVKFTAEWVPPPPGWVGVTNSGDIKSDFSLEVDAVESAVIGIGAHELKFGIGNVEFTIDNQCLPTSTNVFFIRGFISDVSGFQYIYTIEIDATSVEVRNETDTQIFTESYSTVAGDVYRLELSNGFLFYRNGVFRHARTNLGTVVRYPMAYAAGITEATVSAPTRIPPPRLTPEANWQLRPVVTFTDPGHGAISALGASNLTTEYFGGVVPGKYTLIGQVEPAADAGNVQRATATITIPPLQILGPSEITLQPGEKIRPKTNYDEAQSKLVTWSVVSGGGSFAQDEYTAAATPGVSLIRATATVNSSSADISVTVPSVITNPDSFTAAKVSEQIDFATNIPASVMPQFISAGAAGAGTGDVTPEKPHATNVGDLLLLFVETANEAVSTPSGWAIVADSPQGTGAAGGATSTRLNVFWKLVANVDEPGPTVTDPGDHQIDHVLGFRGCPLTGNPWDVTSGDTGSSSTSVSIPGDTTTVDNCLVVLAVANATDTTVSQTSGYTNANLANLTERTDINTDVGNGGGFAVVTGEKAVAGAYAATTATLANASVQGRMSIALKPGGTVWSASIGSINASSGLWTAPSLAGQTAIIKATNGINTVIIEVPVLETFPFTDPTLPVVWDRKLTALISTSEDRRSRATRNKSPSHDSYEIKFLTRTLAQSNTAEAFFDAHGFGKLFILEDTVRGIRKVGWFDSEIRHEGGDECDIALSFRFLEARL